MRSQPVDPHFHVSEIARVNTDKKRWKRSEVFLQRMAFYDLRPVDFSVLSLVTHNPGITSRLTVAERKTLLQLLKKVYE
jgi:hypothetical protein